MSKTFIVEFTTDTETTYMTGVNSGLFQRTGLTYDIKKASTFFSKSSAEHWAFGSGLICQGREYLITEYHNPTAPKEIVELLKRAAHALSDQRAELNHQGPKSAQLINDVIAMGKALMDELE